MQGAGMSSPSGMDHVIENEEDNKNSKTSSRLQLANNTFSGQIEAMNDEVI